MSVATETPTSYRVPGYLFKRATDFLTRYHDMRGYIAEAEQRIIDGGRVSGLDQPVKRTGRPADPTASRGVRLADDWELQQCRLGVRVVRETLDGLDRAKRDLVRLYYWERQQKTSWWAVAEVLGIDERTARRWKDEIIREVAARIIA